MFRSLQNLNFGYDINCQYCYVIVIRKKILYNPTYSAAVHESWLPLSGKKQYITVTESTRRKLYLKLHSNRFPVLLILNSPVGFRSLSNIEPSTFLQFNYECKKYKRFVMFVSFLNFTVKESESFQIGLRLLLIWTSDCNWQWFRARR